jgi:hypothetical protein
MRQIRLVAAAVVWTLCAPSSAALAQKIIAGNASGNAGQQVTVTITLSTGGNEVAGTQNDIGFQPSTRVAAKANGRPDCVVNGDIDKGATFLEFRPRGCSGATCTGIRALVLATDNVSAIPDASVLYTCKVNIAADATNGDHILAVTGVILSDPAGNAVPGASGQNGTVTVSDGHPAPTATVPVPFACDSPAVQVETVTVELGTTDAAVRVKLVADNVAGSQNDIAFSSGTRVKAKADGKPDCGVNGDIDKDATSFAFRPSGCSGETCTGIRALVLSRYNVDVIPTGSVLYTCNVSVAEGASGLQALTTLGVILSDPAGNAIAGAHGCSGGVLVGGGPTRTPTPNSCAGGGPASIEIGSASGTAGQQVLVPVYVHTRNAQVAGALNAISTAGTPIRFDSTPECRPNAALGTSVTCNANPASCGGSGCSAINVSVPAANNAPPIPDGSTLYWFAVTVPAGTAVGTYGLACGAQTYVIDPCGDGLIAACASGRVTVVTVLPTATASRTATRTATRTPTTTPTRTRTPTNTPTNTRTNTPTNTPTKTLTRTPTLTQTPRPTATSTPVITPVRVEIADASGHRGDAVGLAITLHTGGNGVAGVDLTLCGEADAFIRSSANSDRPDCRVNPEIRKDQTVFLFTAPNCMRAQVLSLVSSAAISDGSVLFTCNVQIEETAAVERAYPLDCERSDVGDTIGNLLPSACESGAITVVEGPRCTGDCEGSGSVTINELISLVNISLQNAPLTACPAGDPNGDGGVTINELVQGVNNSLSGCPT